MADHDLCLLSLGELSMPLHCGPQVTTTDGGGVRGLSSLYILQKLMQRINPESPPKPCDYFDLICGTSTGGYSVPPVYQRRY
jgi:hypothetical protein